MIHEPHVAADVDPAPAPPAARRLVVPGGFAVLFLIAAVHTLNRAWSKDAFLHLAVVRALRDDLGSPGHPLVDSGGEYAYYSPYAVLQGAVARVLSLEPVEVLVLAGLANTVLLGLAAGVLVRAFGGDRTTALMLLVFTLLLWGATPWRWSGFLNANSFGFGLPYPSAFATAAAWACLGQWKAYLDGGQRRALAIAIGLGALAVLTHPFTGAWLALALACVLLAHRSWTRVQTLSVLMAATTGALTVLAWPYFDVLDLLAGSSAFTDVHQLLYRQAPQRLVLLAVTLPASLARLRRDTRDPLAIMFVLASAVYAWGWVSETWSLGRVLPLLVLAGHLALALEIGRWHRRSTMTLAVSGACVLGAVGSAAGLARAVPEALQPDVLRVRATAAQLEALQPLASQIGPRDVVVASQVFSERLPAITGRTVAPGFADAGLPDLLERFQANAALLDPTTAAGTRRQLCADYTVDYALLDPAEPLVGRIVASSDQWVLTQPCA